MQAGIARMAGISITPFITCRHYEQCRNAFQDWKSLQAGISGIARISDMADFACTFYRHVRHCRKALKTGRIFWQACIAGRRACSEAMHTGRQESIAPKQAFQQALHGGCEAVRYFIQALHSDNAVRPFRYALQAWQSSTGDRHSRLGRHVFLAGIAGIACRHCRHVLQAVYRHCRNAIQAGFAGRVVGHYRNIRLSLQLGITGIALRHCRQVLK